jgi:hypothetical protein
MSLVKVGADFALPNPAPRWQSCALRASESNVKAVPGRRIPKLILAMFRAVKVHHGRFFFNYSLQIHGPSPELMNVFEHLARVA